MWMFVLLALGTAEPSLLFTVDAAFPDPSVGGAGGGHAIVFWGLDDGNRREKTQLHFLEDAYLRVDGDTSSLRGTAVVIEGPNTGERWIVNVPLIYRGQGDAGVGTGGPKRELAPGAQPHSLVDRWLYFFVGDATMVNDRGDEVYFSLSPANGSYPFQLGFTANGKNTNIGLSGWFGFHRYNRDGTTFGGKGDFNVDLEPLPAFDASILDPL